MASGSYAQKPAQKSSAEDGIRTQVPARATRQLQLPKENGQQDYATTAEIVPIAAPSPPLRSPARPKAAQKKPRSPRPEVRTAAQPRRPGMLAHHSFWLKPWVLCLVGVVVFLSVLLSAGILQRPLANYIYNQGQAVYDIQVGGDKAGSWEQDHPMDQQVKIVPQAGPYAVLHDPTITVDFINRVLSTYKSPTAGKGQALYDLGAQYGIDPAFALAFFMHESSFGTQGEATKSLSLGNLRCIPNHRCADNFAQFDTWEDGFKSWYQLIRNLYIAQWGLTTVDQIIPRYAPQADHNNEAAYIGALKHALDTWHAGQIIVR